MKAADNLVDVAMLTILNTGKAMGHSAKKWIARWERFYHDTTGHYILWAPEPVSGLAAGEQELFTVQILRRCWMTAVSQPTKPFENKVDQ